MRIQALALLVTALTAASSCSKFPFSSGSKNPVVKQVTTEHRDVVAPQTSVEFKNLEQANVMSRSSGATDASTAVEGLITLRKDRLFGREFLYGFDLQYSSSADSEYSLIPQAQAIGHLPSFFRQIGGRLQLLSEQSRMFESNINHPELLIATWDVVSEDVDTVTVKYADSGLIINEVFNGRGSEAPKKSWIRSLRFDAQGEYILQESAIMLQDGSVQTYLESIFPRANLVPAGYKPFDMDPSYNEVAARYRFLANEQVFVEREVSGETVRLQTAIANRYNIGTSGTIDWYVTPNIPDKFLPVIKSGTEGWNRYFKAQLGRDVVRFMGRLPAGVSIGDPRYNVVNWDSVAEAGAAYESQAADPLTGIQSHSLIYLPYAWYNIGVQLWSRRVDTSMPTAKELRDLVAAKSPEVLGRTRRNPLICMLSAEEMSTPLATMVRAIKAEDQESLIGLDEFGTRLLISTLFHEVGHALGLAHDFKGSLAFDGTRAPGADNPTSHSVMDYNYYQNEMDLFTQIGGSEGPSLEYDRQIISQLYNDGADVRETDPVLPACDDAEADNVDGGVDPLCVRYDSENNPVLGVVHSLGNFANPTGAAGTEQSTLAEVLSDLKTSATTRFSDTARNPDANALVADAKAYGRQIGELANYFIAGGAQSLRVNLRNNSKALRVWAEGVEVDEQDFRTRYSNVLKTAFDLSDLPPVVSAKLTELAATIETTIAQNAVAGTTQGERLLAAQKAGAAFQAAVKSKTVLSFTQMRRSIYPELAFLEDSPFAIRLAAGTGTLSHFEELAAESLAKGVLAGLDGTAFELAAFAAERQIAATQLVTFRDIHPAVEQTIAQLNALVIRGRNEGNQALVDEARSLLRVLR